MVGGLGGPPAQERAPRNGGLPAWPHNTSNVGLRLMQEPGFAAHDSHLYRRQALNRGLGESRFGDPTTPLTQSRSQGHLSDLASLGRCPQSGPSSSSTSEFLPRASSLSFHSGRKARPSEEKERRRRRISPISRRTAPSPSCSSPSEGRPLCRTPTEGDAGDLSTNFRAAVSKNCPPVPPGLLKALGTREVPVLGKIRVFLRESPTVSLDKGESSILILDKKRRQVTLQEPRQQNADNRVGVSAPKIFAFDQLYSKEDNQANVISGVLPDILHAVLSGSDGCILCFGSGHTGKSHTMVGSHLREGQTGLIPTSIAWLYRSIAELKSRSSVRFSVRVSAIAIDAPGKVATDVLGEYAQDSETSPGSLLREGNSGLLSSAAELRAPSPETAARYLDLALAARDAISSVQHRNGSQGPATLLYTLHIYQYRVDKSGKGGVIGGRSRLHLLDLGDMSAKCAGGMSLSSLSSILLAIFNGQKYLPHRDNKLTHLLQDTLGLLTCHAAMVVHVSPSLKHSQQSLTTMQLASRVHRLRRKKLRGLGGSGSGGSSEGSQRKSGEDTSAGSSSIDFSSSEQSADTVIYIGGGGPGDSTDGEHPPIFMPHHIRRRNPGDLPRLRSLEQLRPHTASPLPIQSRRPASASPTPTSRSAPLGKPIRVKPKPPVRSYSNGGDKDMSYNGPTLQPGFFRHQPGVSKIYPDTRKSSQLPLLSSFRPQEKGAKVSHLPPDGRQMNYSVYREPNAFVPTLRTSANKSPQIFYIHNPYTQNHLSQPYEADSGKNTIDRTNHLHAKEFIQQNYRQEQQPHPMRQLPTQQHTQQPQHTQQQQYNQHQQRQIQDNSVTCDRQPNGNLVSDEQWIDGPRISKAKVVAARTKTGRSETWIDGPSSTKPALNNYGFMDDHKKTMIEKWIENQSAQVVSNSSSTTGSTLTLETKEVDATPVQNIIEDIVPIKKSNSNEEVAIESDVDTLSEAPSGTASAIGDKQPNLIEELERKNLIPTQVEEPVNSSLKEPRELVHEEINSPVASNGGDPSLEDICSQCEALAEDCEELNSLLSCEEEECKRQIHQGLATVMEEPELESALGADDKDDDLSLLNNPHTDCDDCENESDIMITAASLHKHRPSKLKTTEIAVQVCYEDIVRSMSDTPCPSEITGELSDDHPLRALSEENLTCASTFTADSLSLMGETGDEDESEDEDSHHLNSFEVADYTSIYKKITETLNSDEPNTNLHNLANIHDLFKVFSYKNSPLSPDTDQKVLNDQICHVPREDSSLYSIEPVFDSEDTLCKLCNKKKARHKNNLYKLASCDTDSAYHSSQQMNICTNDKCIGTEECQSKNDRCKCSSDYGSHVSCQQQMIQISNTGMENHICNSGLENSLLDQDQNVNSNLIRNSYDKLKTGDNFIENGINLPAYIKDQEANVVLHETTHFTFEDNQDFGHVNLHNKEVIAIDKSDDESDCPSTISEDSEYIMQNSKLSKFLCVGISKSKSKVSLKNKQNKNCESKRSLFKPKESKIKPVNKIRDINKSPDTSSKNSIGSPSRPIMQNTDRSSSSQVDNPECVQNIESSTSTSFKYRCTVCYKSPGHVQNVSKAWTCSQDSSICPNPGHPVSTISPNPVVLEPLQPALPKHVVHSTGTSGSLGTNQSLGESSGYESIPRDSECSSFSSSQESEMDDEQRREISTGGSFKKGTGVLHPEWSTTDAVQPDHPSRKPLSLLRRKTSSTHWTSQFKYNRS